MARKFVSFCVLSLLIVVFQIVHPCRADEQSDEIKKALTQCPAPRPSDCVEEDELIVRIIKIYGDYAHATIGRVDGSGEIDDAYLKKEKGHWKVLDEGAGIDLQKLGVPREAW